MTSDSDVSIIIPTHNRAHLVGAAIASALSQSPPVPVFVVDDGSTDGTADVLSRLSQNNLRCLYQDRGGAPSARNRGAQSVNTRYGLFLDSDDVLLAGSLAALVQAARRLPDAGVIGGGYVEVDAALITLGLVEPWSRSEDLSLARLAVDCAFIPSASLVRLDWLERVGGFDLALPAAQDWDLWLRLAQAGCPMGWLKRPVCQYRQHGDMLTSDHERRRKAALIALDRVYGQATLPAGVVEQGGLAYGLVHLQAALSFFAAGQSEAGLSATKQAAAYYPPWRDKESVLARLVRQGRSTHNLRNRTSFEAALYAALADKPGAHRRVAARLEAEDVFAAYNQSDWRRIRQGWWRVAIQDPRWLKNLGFVSVGLQAVRGSRSPSAPQSSPTPIGANDVGPAGHHRSADP